MAIPPGDDTDPIMRDVRDLAYDLLANETDNRNLFDKEDYQVVGMYVQLYNWMELNLRRSIKTFVEASILGDHVLKNLYPDKLVKRVKQGVKALDYDQAEELVMVGKLDEIEFRRDMRNILAHWAGRKISYHGEDFFVFLNMDDRDAEQISGGVPEFNIGNSAVMKGADLRGLVVHLIPYEKWISERAAEWYKVLVEEKTL
ncbi:MAG: hypothetical protein ACSHX3_01845 [Litorimonas sp.]